MRTMPLHLQSDDMMERYVKTVEEHLRNVVASHQRDWNKRLPIFILAYMASIHDTTGSIPASLVFGWEIRLPYDLLFGAPPDIQRPTTEHAAELVDHLHDIQHYARQHLKLASDWMTPRCDKLASSLGYHNRMWLYRPTCTKGKSSKFQSSWEGAYKVVTGLNDVVYRIQRNPSSRMMVVHLAPYQGAARYEQA
jgi:hypothetical protein